MQEGGVHGAPRAPHALVERAGFADWMSRHERFGAVMVCGGAGCGKTSALLAWANARALNGETLVWLTLDSALLHRATFWMTALHRFRDAGLPVDEGLTVALERLGSGGEHSLPALLTRQFSPTARPVTLIVDSSGDACVDAGLWDDLVRLAQHESSVRIVFTTRRHPGTTEIESRMPTTLAVSPPALLLLTPEEIAAIAEATNAVVSDHDIMRIAEETGGWALAVIAELGRDSARSAGISAGDAIADDLSRTPGYRGLRALSVTASIDDEMLERIGIDEHARAMVNRGEELGLGWWDDSSPRSFRMLPPLRRALREELVTKSPDEAARAHLVLAKLHLDRGENSAAFAAAVAAADWPLAARLYRRGITRATIRRSSTTAAIRRIPNDALRTQPILMFAAALDDFASGRRARAIRRLTGLLLVTQGRQRVTRRSFTVDDVWAQGIIALALRLLGRYDMSAASIRRVHSMLERTDDPENEFDDAMSLLLSQSAVSLMFADDLDGAMRVLGEAGIDFLAEQPVLDRVRIHGIFALVHTQRGEIRLAAEHLDALSALDAPDGLERSYLAVPAAIARARVMIEHGDGAGAERVLSVTDSHWATTELWPLILHTRVRALWLASGTAAALRALDLGMQEKASATSPSSAMSVMLTMLKCDLLLAAGRGSEAQAFLSASAHRRSRRLTLARARIRLHLGDPRGAASVALAALQSTALPRDASALAVVAAAAGMHMGDSDDETAHRLALPLLIAREHDLVTPFTVVPPGDVRRLLRSAPDVLRMVARVSPFHAAPAGVELTAREQLILEAIAEGSSVSDTAASLSVSANTVKTQRRSLYRKLDVSSRKEALDEARRRGLL
ncbi:LuxR C-terminal-related transcriptional regulator [Microbacterium halotolerans]|uniref:LuxR C-terminal-related transcriptional regulator n=1 Tax=Microbacterium halotolerans TaxID=246613 RepID=UPI000E6AA293|nr:LuxR C-terminal-related transcriptional regulator [Microbacterium halotolerans]